MCFEKEAEIETGTTYVELRSSFLTPRTVVPLPLITVSLGWLLGFGAAFRADAATTPRKNPI